MLPPAPFGFPSGGRCRGRLSHRPRRSRGYRTRTPVEAGPPPYRRLPNHATLVIHHRAMTIGPHVEKAGTVYSRRGDASRAATTVADAEGGALTHGLPTRFAHHSEAELARILDYYRIAWE